MKYYCNKCKRGIKAKDMNDLEIVEYNENKSFVCSNCINDEMRSMDNMTCMICKKKSKYLLEVCVRTHTLYADGNIEDSDTDSSYLIVNTCKKHKKKVLNKINTYVSNVINGFNLEVD